MMSQGVIQGIRMFHLFSQPYYFATLLKPTLFYPLSPNKAI